MRHPRRPPIWGAALVLALVAAAARADDFFGVTPADELVKFSSLDTSVQAPLELTGLGVFEQVVALDVRPATGGLGIAQGLTGSVRLVRIDQASGVVTAIGLGHLVGRIGEDRDGLRPDRRSRRGRHVG